MIIILIDGQYFKVKITRRNIDHYISKGYDVALKDVISVKAEDLINGSHLKVNVECDYCGKIVSVAYRDYVKYKYDKYSCMKCRQRKTSEYNLCDRQDYLYNGLLKTCNNFGYKLVTKKEDILNSETRIQYICPAHGENESKVYTIFLGHGCPRCAYKNNGLKNRKTPVEVYEDFCRYGGKLLNKEDYIGWNEKNLNVICNNCGKAFITSYGSFISGHGQVCPNCSGSISMGEFKIKEFLDIHNIDYSKEFIFYDCRDKYPLRFDFMLKDMNTCIEYDGEGHYMPIRRGSITDDEASQMLKDIQKRDLIKTEYCIQNNINLIRIPYWDYKNIQQILENKLNIHTKI